MKKKTVGKGEKKEQKETYISFLMFGINDEKQRKKEEDTSKIVNKIVNLS